MTEKGEFIAFLCVGYTPRSDRMRRMFAIRE